MKTEKTRNTDKTQALKTRVQPRSAKRQPVKGGVKTRSGLRAGRRTMGFTDMY